MLQTLSLEATNEARAPKREVHADVSLRRAMGEKSNTPIRKELATIIDLETGA